MTLYHTSRLGQVGRVAVIRYEWKCKLCSEHYSVDQYREKLYCLKCDVELVRVYGFAYKRGFQDHYNPSVGAYVRNETEFADKLKQQSERTWLERGIETRLVPIDPRDSAKTGATAEGLENTERVARDSGRADAKTLIL